MKTEKVFIYLIWIMTLVNTIRIMKILNMIKEPSNPTDKWAKEKLQDMFRKAAYPRG